VVSASRQTRASRRALAALVLVAVGMVAALSAISTL